ncbi:PREDICTED: zinc finger protein 62 homolog isoform X2 [Papilio xuthus]|uniref:Zinc finger protein 62 homolog isoform X2 n=1 Tax=Papilio xuthus TaxID=66420 RepID=A0AAJ6Z3B9_PAPXU|nr:PREDICTED: zinc finger protein 62 homolog isoform X2 [Papilio xuthus]
MDFDDIVVKESPGLCRCCLSEGCYKDLSTEYQWMDDTEIYADMLLDCFDISISQHAEGPNGANRLICEVCVTRLRDACNFKKQVLASEKKFVDMVGRGAFKPKAVTYNVPIKSEAILEIQPQETEVEFLEAGMDYPDDDVLKDDLGHTSTDDITVSTLPIKGKKGKAKKTMTKAEKKSCSKIVLVEKPKISKPLTKDEIPHAHENCVSERRRRNLQILFNNTTLLPFKWRGKCLCFYCGESYADYNDFRKHTKSHGPCTTKDYSLKLIKGNQIEIKIDVSQISCEKCNETFKTLKEIVDHLVEKHGLDYDKTIDTKIQEYRLLDFQCLHCDLQFKYFGFLINHVNSTHPRNNYICDDCGATYNKKRDLTLHFRHNHRKGGYPCTECLETFKSHNLLRKHQNDYHFRKCKICGVNFATYSMLLKHVQSEHPDDGTAKCPHCAKQLHSPQGLKQHIHKCKVNFIKIDHPVDDNFTDVLLQPKKKQNLKQIRQNIQCVLNMSTALPFKFFAKYCCFYCSNKFVEFDELKEHTLLEHPICDLQSKSMKKCKGERITVKVDIANLSCKICGEHFENLDILIDHLIIKHAVNYDKSISGCLEPYKVIKDNMPCPFCPNRIFRYFGILLRHINSEHSNNNRICDFCGRSFKSVTNLKVHITYAHTGACECNICGTKYKNQWCLSRHKAKHHNAKDYKCPKCPELFQSQYHKQKHLIQNHNIGHKCSYCGKMFTRNSFMNDHIRRTHLKEKNVVCSVCNEKFFDNYLLRMHMVKHQGERKFNCEVCGKAFLRRSNLSSHKEMHKKYGHLQT